MKLNEEPIKLTQQLNDCKMYIGTRVKQAKIQPFYNQSRFVTLTYFILQ